MQIKRHLPKPEYLFIGFTALICFGFFWYQWFTISAFSKSSKLIYPYDARWFASIADLGYTWDPNNRNRSNVAFFPLYPLFASLFVNLFKVQTIYALLFVSNICAVINIFLVHNFARPIIGKQGAVACTLFFLIHPVYVFSLGGYAESLFMTSTLAAFYYASKDRLGWAAFFAGAAAGTRTFGVFIGYAIILTEVYRAVKTNDFKFKNLMRILGLAFLSLWGLLFFMTYLTYRFGDPLVFNKALNMWGYANPSYLNTFTLYHPFHALYVSGIDLLKDLPQLNPRRVHVVNSALYLLNFAMFFKALSMPKIPLPVKVFTGFVLFFPLYQNSGHHDSALAMNSFGRYQLYALAPILALSAILAKKHALALLLTVVFIGYHILIQKLHLYGQWAG